MTAMGIRLTALDPFQYRLAGGRLASGPARHPTPGKTPWLVDNGKASGRNGSEGFYCRCWCVVTKQYVSTAIRPF